MSQVLVQGNDAQHQDGNNSNLQDENEQDPEDEADEDPEDGIEQNDQDGNDSEPQEGNDPEHADESGENFEEGSDLNHSDGTTKMDVCHKGHMINVSINAVPAHIAHGDAIDGDGDGYFDRENSCSLTDCDDTNPLVTTGPDGDCNIAPAEEDEGLLTGTWMTTDIALGLMVGELTALDYLTDVAGLSPTAAADRVALLESRLITDLDVTLVLYADQSYKSSSAGGTDSGNWSLSPDETTLTLAGGAETIEINLAFVTETTLGGMLAYTVLFDLDGDAASPDEEVAVAATIIMMKS